MTLATFEEAILINERINLFKGMVNVLTGSIKEEYSRCNFRNFGLDDHGITLTRIQEKMLLDLVSMHLLVAQSDFDELSDDEKPADS